jgi:hypothetical protein
MSVNMRNIILASTLLFAMSWTFGARGADPAPAPPKFIIGVWYQPISSFQKWKDRGVNTLVGFTSEDQFSREQWTEAARKAGLFYVIKPQADDPESMKADAADTSLLAWEQPDEPDGAGAIPPDKIVENYRTWKAIGAAKPVLLNLDGWRTQFGKPEEYKQYCQGADWIGFDYYIINRGEGPDNIKKIGERLDKLKEWTGGKKKLFVFIECSDQNLRVSDWGQDTKWGPALAPKMRGPTPDEMKKQVEVSIQHGAAGIIYFPDKIGKNWEAFDNTTPECEAAMKLINGKLNQLAGQGGGSGKATAGTSRPAAADPHDGREVIIDGKTYILKRKD